MRHILVNALAIGSLLLCLASIGLWARSYRRDSQQVNHAHRFPAGLAAECHELPARAGEYAADSDLDHGYGPSRGACRALLG